jgi:DNA-binding NarL/FixJ family response regulator
MSSAHRRATTVVIAAREAVRDRIRRPLESAGIEIAAESSDLVEALEAVVRQRPKLCLLDRDLPGAGVTTIAALATPRPRPKVLVIGGGSDPAGIRADRLAGATRSLPGDTDPDRVAAALIELASEAVE